jgi:hypothetical protein
MFSAVFPSFLHEDRSTVQLPKRRSFISRRWTKSKRTVLHIITHHRQKPSDLDCINSVHKNGPKWHEMRVAWQNLVNIYHINFDRSRCFLWADGWRAWISNLFIEKHLNSKALETLNNAGLYTCCYATVWCILSCWCQSVLKHSNTWTYSRRPGSKLKGNAWLTYAE